jgi:hypothetical protein
LQNSLPETGRSRRAKATAAPAAKRKSARHLDDVRLAPNTTNFALQPSLISATPALESAGIRATRSSAAPYRHLAISRADVDQIQLIPLSVG